MKRNADKGFMSCHKTAIYFRKENFGKTPKAIMAARFVRWVKNSTLFGRKLPRHHSAFGLGGLRNLRLRFLLFLLSIGETVLIGWAGDFIVVARRQADQANGSHKEKREKLTHHIHHYAKVGLFDSLQTIQLLAKSRCGYQQIIKFAPPWTSFVFYPTILPTKLLRER